VKKILNFPVSHFQNILMDLQSLPETIPFCGPNSESKEGKMKIEEVEKKE
jgi:hypothetical protein